MPFLTFLIAFLIVCTNLFSQTIINGYARVTAVSGTTLTISPTEQSEVASTGTFAVGMNVIVMQMQDNVIGTNTSDNASFGNLSSIQSAGLYEVATLSSVSRNASMQVTSVTLTTTLSNSYNTGANSTLQIITYPTLGSPNYTTTDNLTALSWNGNIGGVLAFRVNGILTLQHNLNVNARGFRRGLANSVDDASGCSSTPFIASDNRRAGKGEGIYRSTSASFSQARGKILNGGGGGNFHNGGGGGGGNFSVGGDGGPGWDGSGVTGCSPSAGGIGGIALAGSISVSRIFMGGGGGGGQQNNFVATNGGNGGGIILLRANEVRTTGTCGITISANGESAGLAGNDGGGGGGAGGSIVLQVVTWNIAGTCPITVSANGGNGGTVNSSTHGGGGGGGQGAIFYSIARPTSNTTTTTNAGAGGCNNNSNPCNSQAGNGGGPNNVGIFDQVNTPLPVELLYFYARKIADRQVVLYWATQRLNIQHFEIEKAINQAQNFQTIGSELARQSSQQENYQFFDNDFTNQTTYYRLKVYFADGRTDYSKIIAINGIAEEQNLLSVYPNPFEKEFWIENVHERVEKILIQDLWGRELFAISQPKSKEKIDLTAYPKGTYLVLIISQEKTEVKKIVKF